MTDAAKPQDIVAFWMDLGPKRWWRKDPKLDEEIKARFGATLDLARRGKLEAWRDDRDAVLAYVIVLDQFSRNVFRDDPRAYASDATALDASQAVVERGWDMAFPPEERQWFYLPYMHSEDPAMQERCIELCKRSRLDGNLPSAIEHADIIRRFGRFPHRNKVLGRVSTEEEEDFLATGGFSG